MPTKAPSGWVPKRGMVPVYGKLTAETVSILSVAEELRKLADMLQSGRNLNGERLAYWFRDTGTRRLMSGGTSVFSPDISGRETPPLHGSPLTRPPQNPPPVFWRPWKTHAHSVPCSGR
jgi:hypothetical protein